MLADHSTIHAAIDAAQNGDTIIVAPGVYNESLDTRIKSFHLRSANGPAQTTLDGTGLDMSILHCPDNGHNPLVIVEGFTFIRGGGTLASGHGTEALCGHLADRVGTMRRAARCRRCGWEQRGQVNADDLMAVIVAWGPCP